MGETKAGKLDDVHVLFEMCSADRQGSNMSNSQHSEAKFNILKMERPREIHSNGQADPAVLHLLHGCKIHLTGEAPVSEFFRPVSDGTYPCKLSNMLALCVETFGSLLVHY